ncbi:MAG: hypothetical protein AAF602_12480, partial [Myxococcota bacterium]
MSDDEESSGRGGWIAGLGVVALAAVGGAVAMYLFGEGTPDVIEKPARPPRPTVKPARPGVGAIVPTRRVSLAPPADRERPVRPDEAEPTNLTPGMRQEMNYFVDDILDAAHDTCIRPWMRELPPSVTAEFVFDAVLYDGQMYDIGVRSLDHEMPDDLQN